MIRGDRFVCLLVWLYYNLMSAVPICCKLLGGVQLCLVILFLLSFILYCLLLNGYCSIVICFSFAASGI